MTRHASRLLRLLDHGLAVAPGDVGPALGLSRSQGERILEELRAAGAVLAIPGTPRAVPRCRPARRVSSGPVRGPVLWVAGRWA